MRNIRKVLFLILLLIYATGIFAGAVREVKMPEQAEMYDFLKNSVSVYDTTAAAGIKSVAKDNIKLFLLMAVAGFFKPFVWLFCVAMFAKGYTTGFSVMAVLRLYGIKGMLLCGANMLSAAVLVPACAYYGGFAADGLFSGNLSVKVFRRRYFFSIIILIAIFCADSIFRGALSSIFMKWGAKIMS